MIVIFRNVGIAVVHDHESGVASVERNSKKIQGVRALCLFRIIEDLICTVYL